MSGPPESPEQLSVLWPPAQTIEVELKCEPQAAAHEPSPTIGTCASRSDADWLPVSVTPQPMTVACVPALQRAASAAPVPARRNGSCGTAAARCRSARSLLGVPLAE